MERRIAVIFQLKTLFFHSIQPTIHYENVKNEKYTFSLTIHIQQMIFFFLQARIFLGRNLWKQ